MRGDREGEGADPLSAIRVIVRKWSTHVDHPGDLMQMHLSPLALLALAGLALSRFTVIFS